MKELEVAVPRAVYMLLVLLGLAVCGCSHKPAGKPLQMLWSTPIASSDRPVVSGSKLFIRGFHAGNPLEKSHLYALDATTGKEKWRYAPFSNALRIDSQGVWLSTFASIYGESSDFNALLDSDTGKEQWRHRGFFVGTPAGGLVWQSHHVAHMDFSKNYTGDKRGNKLKGGIATPESVHSSWLEGLDSESQRTVWQSEVSLTTEMSQPFVADSVIYVSSISEMKEGLSSVRAYRLPASGEPVGSP